MTDHHKLPTIDTIGSHGKPRTLVLCFDGTTDIYDDDNTNIVKLFSLLEKNDRSKQMVYYQPGVGTYTPPGIFMPITMAIAKVLDQAIALYLDQHVMGGYEFLMKHYNDGDKICLFGFSRGAYTARALAGMLHKIGLLPPDNIEQIPFAYSMYNRSDVAGFKASAGFKKAFCRSVRIEFIGVWDTVSSVGLLWPRHLPFTSSNGIVKTFRHAVSLDEHRAKFKQNVWHVHAPDASKASRDPDHGSPVVPNITPRIRTSPTTILKTPQKELHSLDPLPNSNTWIIPPTPPEQENPLPHRGETQAPRTGNRQTDLRNFFGPASASSDKQGYNKSQKSDAGHSQEHSGAYSRSSDSETERSKCSLGLNEIASSIDPSSNIDAKSSNKSGPNSYKTGIMDWVRDLALKKPSTQPSGLVAFEEAWEEEVLTTDVLEVWFAGCHSDVGGGSELNKTDYSLSNISLRWMIRQIVSSQCGIRFDQTALKKMNIPFPALGFGETDTSFFDRLGTNAARLKEAQEREQLDALAPIHDQLVNPLWWPLEFLPLVHSYQDEKGEWHSSFRWNLFQPRHPRKTLGTIKVHKSVHFRREHSDYAPRAILGEEIEYVN